MADPICALAPYLEAGGRDGAGGRRNVTLTVVRGWGLAHLRVFPGRDAEFGEHLHACSGAQPPAELYRGITGGNSRLYRLTRDQYWWIGTDAPAMQRLARTLPAATGAITILSASRVRLRVAGAAARDVLAKGIGLDLHPTVFLPGHAAQTGLHHTAIFLERSADERYELFLPRTYAASIWEWLIDAALPHGYDLASEELTHT